MPIDHHTNVKQTKRRTNYMDSTRNTTSENVDNKELLLCYNPPNKDDLMKLKMDMENIDSEIEREIHKSEMQLFQTETEIRKLNEEANKDIVLIIRLTGVFILCVCVIVLFTL